MTSWSSPNHEGITYLLWLNPAKCTFAVSFGNFLGFLVCQRGIEMAPGQVLAITQMQPPTMRKEIQALIGGLEQVYFMVFRLITAFLQSIKRG